MRNLYARFVLWLIRPALELGKEQAEVSKSFFFATEQANKDVPRDQCGTPL